MHWTLGRPEVFSDEQESKSVHYREAAGTGDCRACFPDCRDPDSSCEALVRIEGADRFCEALIRLAGTWFVPLRPDLFSTP